MQVERERKFLIMDSSAPIPAEGLAITQGYLAIEPGGNEVRIRQKGDWYFLTVKSGENGLSRSEAEIEISAEQFRELWPLARQRAIEKVRYQVPLQEGLIAEVDVFSGRHSGLILIEVEFESEEAAAAFTVPPWFGQEVTTDSRYKNKNLALQNG